jgi:hypothetical protein
LKEPESFEDAYYHPNHEDRMKWREAISKEFDEMKEKEVYEKICKSELPNGCGYSKLNAMEFFVHG